MHFIPISGQGGVNRQYYEYDGKEYYNMFSEQQTESSNLGVNSESLITYYLDCQTTGHNKLTIKTEYPGNRPHITEHEIYCP